MPQNLNSNERFKKKLIELIEKHLGPSSQIQNFDVQKVETDALRIMDLEDENRNENSLNFGNNYTATQRNGKSLYYGRSYSAIIAACCYMQVKSQKNGLNMSHYVALCRNKGFPKNSVGIDIIDRWGEKLGFVN